MRTLFAVAGNLLALAAGFGLLARYVSPQIFWPPAIIALFLPALLLLTLLFFLIQLTRRRWASLAVPALVLITSIPIVDRLIAWPKTTAPEDTAATLTIVTGNQRMFRYADGTDVSVETVGEFFQELNADILLLQEVWPRSKRNADYIDAIQSSSSLRRRHQEPGTLMATYGSNIVDERAYFDKSEYHGILLTDMDTELGTIRIINAHLQSNKISGMAEDIRGEKSVSNQVSTFGHMVAGYGRTTRRRAEQAELIKRLVQESPYPVVLGGDFNDVPTSYAYNVLESRRLKDAWVRAGGGLGTTFTGPLPGLRIDYFMVDTSLQVVDIERVNSPWSDHRALRLTVSK